MKNYYDILEVSRKASKDTINKVFKMHIKSCHPDLFQGDEKIKAEEKSKEYTEAYNILSDDNERAKYDAELEAEEAINNNSPQLQTILEENEYLKQVIAKKNEYITRLTSGYNNLYSNGYGNPYNNEYAQQQQYNPYTQNGFNQYGNQYNNAGGYGGFNGFTPPQQQNPYEGMTIEELKQLKKEQTILYYKEKFKEVGIKLIILILLIIVLVISLYSSFKDILSTFNR